MPRFIICGATNGDQKGMLCLFDKRTKTPFFPPYPQLLGNVIARAIAGAQLHKIGICSYDINLIDQKTREKFGIVSTEGTYHAEWVVASIKVAADLEI